MSEVPLWRINGSNASSLEVSMLLGALEKSKAATPTTPTDMLAEMGGIRVERCSRHHEWWDDPEDAGCIEGVRYGDYLRCDKDEVVWIVKEDGDE